MISLLVTLEIDPARIEHAIECIRVQAEASRQEPGCRRWEVSRKLDKENIFTLAELYDDAAALQAHFESPHFKQWVANTGDGLILSKTSVRGQVLDL
ncbi:MAG: antibiotic biosynthesis monooxygenase [Verrucomicrobia bacterium]|nr:antibiotic biosynthesis monooxygenase [Verrucomicrobiota bacterium]